MYLVKESRRDILRMDNYILGPCIPVECITKNCILQDFYKIKPNIFLETGDIVF